VQLGQEQVPSKLLRDQGFCKMAPARRLAVFTFIGVEILLLARAEIMKRRPLSRIRASNVAAARSPLAGAPLPTSANCTWMLFNQTLNHFARGAGPGSEVFSQRICMYDGFVKDKYSPTMVLFCTYESIVPSVSRFTFDHNERSFCSKK
jgi:hypothetical protein